MPSDQSDPPPDTATSPQERLRLQSYTAALEAVDEIGRILTAELDLTKLVQSITDITTRMTGAEFGAYFYNVVDEKGESYSLFTISGVPKDAFANFPMPRSTDLFGPTFRGEGIIRLDDVLEDARYGKSEPHRGMPAGHLPVRSYLAAPVTSRTGAVLGGLFFGHSTPGKFTEDHERQLAGIARYAAIAIDNAKLFEQVKDGDLANARLAAIVQSSDDSIVSKDLNGIVRSWNQGAERMFGYTAAEMIGKPITVLIPPERPDEEAKILERLRRGERVDHFETIRVTKGGKRIHVSVTISPIRDASGQIVGASKVARDITQRVMGDAERDQLLAAERAARSEAERHSRMKDEFLATLGHELRTPLNAVLGWTQLMQAQNPGSGELSNGLAVIERNARLQAQLIEDLLDMGRIVSGKLSLHVQPVQLGGVIRASIESVRPAAEAKGIRLLEVLDPLAGPVSGDPNRLQQVLWNLLSNAVKFTPKDGRVQVLLERVNSHVEIAVVDSGEGILPEFLPFVFDRFRQADSTTTRRHGGLGLGLAIAKHLVELHGGSIRVKSPGVGKGTTFTVSLPLRAAHREEGHTHPVTSEGQPAAASAELGLAGLKALVVDDDADSRELVRRILEGAGVSVRVCASAPDALTELRERSADVLVSDIGMPQMDGYGLIRSVRAEDQQPLRNIPAVALTAFARPEDRRRALLAGFQMHVPKPVEAAELLAVVASVTRRL